MEVLLYLCWYVFNIEFYLFSLLRNQDLLYMSPTILSLNFLLLLGGRLIFWLLAWDLVVTIPVVYFFFKETKKVSLEDIDLLFCERALGTLPDDLTKGDLEVPEAAKVAEVEHTAAEGPKT